MTSTKLSAWGIAATYIGTVVGAGFASGQETLRFFAVYGASGFAGIIVATLGFAGFGVLILKLGHRLQASSYAAIFEAACGSWLGKLIDAVVTLFLFAALVVMLAGAGAIFEEYLGLAKLWGVGFSSILAFMTVYRGLSGVISANTLLIPLMLLLTLGIGIFSLSHHGIIVANLDQSASKVAVAPHWMLAALLYLSYNLILAVPVLAPMGKAGPNRQILLWGGILGGLGLGLLSSLLALVLMAHFPQVVIYEIPMLFIVQPYNDSFRLLYAFILWSEVFTTLIANLFGFAQRVSQQAGLSYQLIVPLSLILAMALSRIGFSTLVGSIYPLMGYLGCVFLLGLSQLAWKSIRFRTR